MIFGLKGWQACFLPSKFPERKTLPLSLKDHSMNSLAGIGLKLLATVLFAIMIAIIKLVVQTAPTGQVVFARSFFALLPLFVMALMQGDLRDCFRVHDYWAHVRRSLAGACAMFLWFTAIGMLPLPEATAISFLAPLMVVALAAFFLKEKVGIYRWSAVGVGFVGVLVIMWPRLASSEGDVELLGAALALISTLFVAIASILVRQMTKTETNAAIMFYFFLVSSVFSLGSVYFGWILPGWKLMGLLFLSGLLGGVAQICLTQAFRLTEASLLAPFDYISMVWAVLIGFFLFGEVPTLPVVAGAMIVTSAGLFVVFRERHLGLSRKAENRSRSV